MGAARLATVVLAVLLTGLPSSLPADEEGGEQPTADPCPWVPRSGNWRFSSGSLTVDGLWTPLGGGQGTVRVEVTDCGDVIKAYFPGMPLIFEPYEGAVEFEGRLEYFVDTPWRRQHEFSEDVMYDFHEELLQLLLVWTTLDQMERERLAKEGDAFEPPEKLALFETNVYRATNFNEPQGAWYLDYVTQYEMYSVIRSEGVDAPEHKQFHYWRYVPPAADEE